VVFILLLTTAKPVKNSLFYLAGLTLSYFVCGIIGFAALDKLTVFVAKISPAPAGVSDTNYYKTQIIVGLIFTAIGVIYYKSKKNSVKPQMENVIIGKLRNMNTFVAFAIGVFVSVTGFPLSLPYIAVLGKLALLKMAMPEVVPCLVLYNIFYALPMMAIFMFYLFARGDSEGMEDRLNERARKLNLKLTSAMFVGMGLFSIADSMVFFLCGHPMMKNRFF
jgi:cytochrome c biogenesis protein CcdA